MLWVTLNSHWVFAMKLKPLSRNFGGAKKGKKGRSIGWEELTKSKLEGGVEFRDIAMFNDSLLAKQVWWLLKNSDSLFPKVFKAHFFPNCTFMEAKHTSGGSHAWNSILHGRDVLLRAANGGLGMERLWAYGKTSGYQGKTHHRYYHLLLKHWQMLKWRFWLTKI